MLQLYEVTGLSKITLKMFLFVCFLFFFFLILSGFLIFLGAWNQFIFRGVTLQFADPQ